MDKRMMEQTIVCYFNGGPMHGTVLDLPDSTRIVSFAEPMLLIAAGDDEGSDPLVYIDRCYTSDEVVIEGRTIFTYNPHQH